MWPIQEAKLGTVEAVMAALDREALVRELPAVIRAIILKTMQELGFSTAGMHVTLVVKEIAQRWGLVLTKPGKKLGASKLHKKLTKSSTEVEPSIHQQVSLLEPLLERLVFQSIIEDASPPLSIEAFEEQMRLALLEHEGSCPTRDTIQTLIRWLDDHDYLLVDQGAVQVIAIPVLSPDSIPD